MSVQSARVPAPPEGLRPAQMGIVLLGRPILGHAAVTLTDLAERKLLRATEIGDDRAGDWLLEWPSAESLRHPRTGPLPFEQALLDGLLHKADRPLLTGLAESLAPALRRFAHALSRDAVHRGWLRRVHHDQRTPDGERLAAQIRSFRNDLRRLKASGGERAVADHLAYALLFGLASREEHPHARLAASWIQACSGVPGWMPGEARRGRMDDPDFTRDDEWRGMGLAGAIALSSSLC